MRRALAAFRQRLAMEAMQFPGSQRWPGALGAPLSGEARLKWELVHTNMDGSAFSWGPYSQWDPVLSFDKPPIHGGRDKGFQGRSVLSALGLEARHSFPLPPHSPDIHRVIEHTHARLVGEFSSWLYTEQSNTLTMQDYKKKLLELFWFHPKVAQPAVIWKDVQGLPALYQSIVERGGTWAFTALR